MGNYNSNCSTPHASHNISIFTQKCYVSPFAGANPMHSLAQAKAQALKARAGFEPAARGRKAAAAAAAALTTPGGGSSSALLAAAEGVRRKHAAAQRHSQRVGGDA